MSSLTDHSLYAGQFFRPYYMGTYLATLHNSVFSNPTYLSDHDWSLYRQSFGDTPCICDLRSSDEWNRIIESTIALEEPQLGRLIHQTARLRRLSFSQLESLGPAELVSCKHHTFISSLPSRVLELCSLCGPLPQGTIVFGSVVYGHWTTQDPNDIDISLGLVDSLDQRRFIHQLIRRGFRLNSHGKLRRRHLLLDISTVSTDTLRTSPVLHETEYMMVCDRSMRSIGHRGSTLNLALYSAVPQDIRSSILSRKRPIEKGLIQDRFQFKRWSRSISQGFRYQPALGLIRRDSPDDSYSTDGNPDLIRETSLDRLINQAQARMESLIGLYFLVTKGPLRAFREITLRIASFTSDVGSGFICTLAYELEHDCF